MNSNKSFGVKDERNEISMEETPAKEHSMAGRQRSGAKKALKVINLPKAIKNSLGEIYCEVCFELARHDDFNTKTESNRIMFCKDCHVPVHVSCYGLKTPHEMTLNQYDEQVIRFTCDRCTASTSGMKIETECLVCNLQTGAMKKTSDGSGFIHVTCALTCDFVKIEDFERLTVNATGLREEKNAVAKMGGQFKGFKCSYCSTTNWTQPCCHEEKCPEAAHIYCATRAAAMQSGTNKKGWQLVLNFCKNNNIRAGLTLNDGPLEASVENFIENLDRNSEIVNRFLPHSLNSNENSMDLETSKKLRAGGGKKKTEILYREIMECVRSNIEHDTNIINGGVKKQQPKLKRFTTTPLVLPGESKRGGEMTFLCPEHNKTSKIFDKEFHNIIEACSQRVLQGRKEKEHEVYKEDIRSILQRQSPQTYLTIRQLILLAEIFSRHTQRSLLQVELARAAIFLGVCLPLQFIEQINGIFRRLYYTNGLDLISNEIIKENNLFMTTWPASEREINALWSLHELLRLISVEFNSSASRITSSTHNEHVIYETLIRNLLRTLVFNSRANNMKWKASFVINFENKSAVEELKEELTTLKNSGFFDKLPQFEKLWDKVEAITTEVAELENARMIVEETRGTANLSQRLRVIEGYHQKEMRKLVIVDEKGTRTLDSKKTIPVLDGRRSQLFEQNMKRFIQLLSERPTLEELQQAVANKTAGEDMEVLSENLQLAQRWHHKLNTMASKPNKKFLYQEFYTLLMESIFLGVTTAEIVAVAEQFKNFTVLVYDFMKLGKRLKIGRKAATQTNSMEDEASQAAIDESVKMSELDAVTQGLQESSVWLDREDDKIKLILDKIQDARQLGERLKQQLRGVENIGRMKEIEEDFSRYNVEVPELVELRSVIRGYNEIADLLETSQYLEKLLEKLAELKSGKVHLETTVLNDLEAKIENGRRVQQKCQSFLAKSTNTIWTEDDIVTANLIVFESRKFKVICKEYEEVQRILRTCDWLENLNNILTEAENGDDLPYNTQTRMEIEASRSQFSSASELANYTRYCKNQVNLLPQPIPPQLFSRLQTLVDDARRELIPIRDTRIDEIYTSLAALIWKQQARDYLIKTEPTFNELTSLVKNVPASVLKSSDSTFDYLSQKLTLLNKWKNNVETIKNAFTPADNLFNLINSRDARSLEKYRSNLMDLQKEYKEEYTSIPDLIVVGDDVTKLLNWINWGVKAYEMLTGVEKGKKIRNLNELQSMAEDIQEYQLPRTIPLVKQIESIYTSVTNLLEHMDKVLQTKNNLLESSRELLKPGVSSQQIDDFLRKKPSLSQAVALLDEFQTQGGRFVNLDTELSELSDDIGHCQEWLSKAQSFVEQYNLKSINWKAREGADVGNLDKILDDLLEYKRQAVELPFYVDLSTNGNNFFAFEFMLRSVVLIQGKSREKAGVSEWGNILRHADLLIELDPILLKLVKEEMQTAELLRKECKDVKQLTSQRTELKTYDDLLLLNKRIDDCKISLGEEAKFIEDVTIKAQHIIEDIDRLLNLDEPNKSKGNSNEFSSLLEAIRRLPVQLVKYETKLEGAIERATKLSTKLKYTQVVDVPLAESIIKEYRQCPVYIADAQRVQNAYEDSLRKLEQVKKDLVGEQNLSFDVLGELSHLLDEVQFDFGTRLSNARVDVLKGRISTLRDLLEYNATLPKQNIGNNNTAMELEGGYHETLPFVVLQGLLTEAYTVWKQYGMTKNDELTKEIRWLESIVRQVEGYILEIYDIHDDVQLDKINHLVANTIDVSQIIIEHKSGVIVDRDYVSILQTAIIVDQERFDELPDFKPLGFTLHEHIPSLPPVDEHSRYSHNSNSRAVVAQNSKSSIVIEKKPRAPIRKLKRGQHEDDEEEEQEEAPQTTLEDLIPLRDRMKPIKERPSMNYKGASEPNNYVHAIGNESATKKAKKRERLINEIARFEEEQERKAAAISQADKKKKSVVAAPSNVITISEAIPIDDDEIERAALEQRPPILTTVKVTKEERVTSVAQLQNALESVKAYRGGGLESNEGARLIEEKTLYPALFKDRARYRAQVKEMELFLRKLIDFPYVARFLARRRFPTKTLTTFFHMETAELAKKNQEICVADKTRMEEMKKKKEEQQASSTANKPPKPIIIEAPTKKKMKVATSSIVEVDDESGDDEVIIQGTKSSTRKAAIVRKTQRLLSKAIRKEASLIEKRAAAIIRAAKGQREELKFQPVTAPNPPKTPVSKPGTQPSTQQQQVKSFGERRSNAGEYSNRRDTKDDREDRSRSRDLDRRNDRKDYYRDSRDDRDTRRDSYHDRRDNNNRDRRVDSRDRSNDRDERSQSRSFRRRQHRDEPRDSDRHDHRDRRRNSYNKHHDDDRGDSRRRRDDRRYDRRESYDENDDYHNKSRPPRFASDLALNRAREEADRMKAGKRSNRQPSVASLVIGELTATLSMNDVDVGPKVVYKIFEGTLRYSHQDIMTIYLFSLTDSREIVKCPRVSSYGDEKLLDVSSEVSLTSISNDILNASNPEEGFVVIAGWLEVRGNEEALDKLTKHAKELFNSGRAFAINYTKFASLYIMEEESFRSNYDSTYGHLLRGYLEQLDADSCPRLVYLLVSCEHTRSNNFLRIIPEVSTKPNHSNTKATIDQLFEKATEKENTFVPRPAPTRRPNLVDLTHKPTFSSVNFLTDFGAIADIISIENLIHGLLPLYHQDLDTNGVELVAPPHMAGLAMGAPMQLGVPALPQHDVLFDPLPPIEEDYIEDDVPFGRASHAGGARLPPKKGGMPRNTSTLNTPRHIMQGGQPRLSMGPFGGPQQMPWDDGVNMMDEPGFPDQFMQFEDDLPPFSNQPSRGFMAPMQPLLLASGHQPAMMRQSAPSFSMNQTPKMMRTNSFQPPQPGGHLFGPSQTSMRPGGVPFFEGFGSGIAPRFF